MSTTRLTAKVLLALACCLVIVLIPVSASAQEGIIKKGAEGVKKGAETVGEKTKEGAEAVGEGVKKAVTDEDKDKDKTRMKSSTPSTAPSQETKSGAKTKSTTTTTEGTKREKPLPGTAGELPMLALVGILGLAAAGAARVIRREN